MRARHLTVHDALDLANEKLTTEKKRIEDSIEGLELAAASAKDRTQRRTNRRLVADPGTFQSAQPGFDLADADAKAMLVAQTLRELGNAFA